MKIVIGSESFAPNISGVATAAELLANNLACEGHQVWVFAPSFSYKTQRDDTFENFKVVRIKSIRNPFRKNFRVSFFPGKDVFAEIRKIKPDIIHLEDPTSICSELLKAGKRYKIPVVLTNHFSLDYITSYFRRLKILHPAMRSGFRNYLRKFYNKCDYITCPTETTKAELLSWGVKAPIEAISNGIDLDRFYEYFDLEEFNAKFHLPPNKRVLYVGRIDKDKNIEVLIRAIPHVAAETNAHFVIVGDGKETDKMKKIAESLGVDRHISWLGWIDQQSDDIIQSYQSADVFVMPSKIETQSIATMEAMAAGLPVVGANGGAIPELVTDEKNGYLFDPNSDIDLGEKITLVLTDQKRAKKMGAASLKKIACHEIAKNFDKINIIYEKVLADIKK